MNRLRRACLAVCLSATAALVAGGAFAQVPPPPLPLQSAPLPPPLPAAGDPPAPPKAAAAPAAASPQTREEYRGSPDDEPQVTTIRKENETVEEVRIGGELRYVRVTPRHGVPTFSYLRETAGRSIAWTRSAPVSACRCGCCFPGNLIRAHEGFRRADVRRTSACPSIRP